MASIAAARRGPSVVKNCSNAALDPSFTDPHDVADVVVGHDGQRAVELVEAAVVDVVDHDPHDDRVDRFLRAAQQSADAALVHPLCQPRHDVLEIAGVPSLRTRPWHQFGTHPTAGWAVDAVDIGFQPHLAGTEVQVSPPPPG
jgi:hypothetical protein